MGENKPMKQTISEQPQTRKPYKLTRAAKMQRRDAALKSAKARRTNDKWRSAAVTERFYSLPLSSSRLGSYSKRSTTDGSHQTPPL